MKNNQKISILTIFLSALLVSTYVQAGNISTSTKANATLGSYCNVSSTDINFGTLKLNGVPNYSNGAIYIECSNKVSYNIAITFGHPDTKAPYYNGRPNDGQMIGAISGDIIDYAITSTLNGAWSWGLTSAVNGVGNGQVQTYTTYGVSQTGFAGHSLYPTSDTYSDSATITLSY